jgi:hypothetical protein
MIWESQHFNLIPRIRWNLYSKFFPIQTNKWLVNLLYPPLQYQVKSTETSAAMNHKSNPGKTSEPSYSLCVLWSQCFCLHILILSLNFILLCLPLTRIADMVLHFQLPFSKHRVPYTWEPVARIQILGKVPRHAKNCKKIIALPDCESKYINIISILLTSTKL